MKTALFFLASLCWVLLAAGAESPHGEITLDCNQCHVTSGWHDLLPQLKFDHNQTSYPLVGRHAGVQCLACHSTLNFAEAGTACIDCHTDIHRGQFSATCGECHAPDGWSMTEKMRVRHDATRFPLIGVHAKLDCQACHANGRYVNVSIDCEGCHLDQYRATDNPSHVAAAFSTQCNSCHALTTVAWRNAEYAHPESFPLAGGHAISDCNRCHAAGYAELSGACYPCHSADFGATTNPNHESGNFSQNCAECHGTETWQGAAFNHDLSGFPLSGRHVNVDCALCHVGGQYTGTPTDCYECHRANFEATTNPDHEAGNYPHTCVVCHSTNGWSPANFDHNLTDFPLTGRHVSVNCTECHAGGNYSNTPSDCWSCHEQAYRNSNNPDHEQLSFPQTCNSCHSTDGWSPASFDHSNTDFPLTGRHVSASCTECHIDGNYNNTPTDCWSCHQTDYNDADDHLSGSYPHDCAMCHSANNWDSNFNHNNTDYPLTGRHVDVNCAECHVNGQFNGTPTDCWSCHQEDYNDAEDHLADNYPHDCLQCHSTNGWDEGFNHSNTGFPLTGAHIQTSCTACHINGQFQGTPTDCFFCHEQDYHDANDPNHDAGFAHQCLDCHTTTGWTPAQFNHDGQWFPIYSGEHRNEWNQCSECHTNPDDFGVFSCIDCHEHSRAHEDDNHEEVGGYVYESQACYNCHPTGEGDSGPHLRQPTRRERN